MGGPVFKSKPRFKMSLSNREEKLALGVLVVVVLGALSVSTSRVRAWRATLWEQEVAVQMRETEAQELRNGGVLWEERRRWISGSLPSHPNDGDARSSLVSAVQEAARAHAVSLQSQKLIDPEADGKSGEETAAPSENQPKGFALVVSATGDLKNLVAWWHELLRPDCFRQINFLKVAPEDDSSELLRCSVEIWQWYRLSPESPGVGQVSPSP
jgi:hypothetical protein